MDRLLIATVLLAPLAACVQDSDKIDGAVSKPAGQEIVPAEYTNGIGMRFCTIPAGAFTMGRPNGNKTERPYQVTISQSFQMGVTEVTQAQWTAVMSTDPSKFKGDDLPVESITWEQAEEFCRKLSEREKRRYRLPTEAEWEYGCRAGSKGAYCFGDNAALLDQYAWHNGNANMKTHPVAGRKSNVWGLHDMHGNVREWCSDWFVWSYPTQAQTDPRGPENGSQRVRRGGCWSFYPEICQSGYRDASPPEYPHYDLGLRVVLESEPEPVATTGPASRATTRASE